MSSIVHITNANELSISNNQLVMSNIEIENKKEVNKISLKDILAIIIENCRCKITGILQLRLSEKNIPLIICNEKHQPVLHSLGLYDHFQVTTRIKEQVNWLDIKKNELWSRIAAKKIKNQRNLLQFLNKSEERVLKLEIYEKNILIRGREAEHQEAIAARIYFQELFGKNFKRFDDDGINSALNYGYALLRSLISSKIVAKGFHPSLGIHHKSQFNNYNFSDDIIEIFRPMVDYIVYFNQKENVRLSKELRQKLLLILTQKIYWKNKKYELSQVIEYFLDNIRNYFIDENTEIEIPELRIEDYEY